MAAPELSARPPKMAQQKPSRLPLHRSRPFTDKSNTPALLSISQTENSQTSVIVDANKRSERHISGSRATHKSTQVRLNRMSLQGPQSVVDEVRPHRWSESQIQSRLGNATGVVSVSSATTTAHLVNGGVIDDGMYAVRMAGSPKCGVRMSALRSAGREQQPSLTTSTKSSSSATTDRHAARRRDPVAVGLDRRRDVAEPRDAAMSHHSSTSSIDSACFEYLQRHAPPAVPRCTVSLSADDKQPDRNCRDSSASQSFRKPEVSRQIISRKSDKVTSPRSDCFRPPVSRQISAADQQPNEVQRIFNGCRSASVSNVLRTAEHQRQLDNAIVEPRRCYYRPWRLSDEFSAAGSMSTITSVDSFLSSSSGTLTDDADESADESTTTTDRDKRQPDRGHHLCTSDVCSDRHACCAHVAPPSYRASMAFSHKTRTSGCASRESSSSELPSSLSATSSSQQPAENCLEATKRTGNVRMNSHAPVTRSKHTTASPSAPQQKCSLPHSAANRPKNRPPSTSDNESNVLSSPRRLPSDAKTAAAGHVTHSPPLAAVGRFQKTVIDDRSLMKANSSVPTSVAVKPRTSPPHSHVQTRLQTAAVRKAARVTGVSNSKSSVSSPSKEGFQAPLQRASGIPVVSTASKISSALRDTRRTRTGTGLPCTNAVDKSSPHVTNGRELVDKSVVDVTAGVMASRHAVKPSTTAMIKHAKSPKSGTDNSTDNRCSRKSVRGVSTPTAKTQTSSTAATLSTTRDNEKTAVAKRPPAPPQIKKASVPCMSAAADRRRVSVAEQKRPASMDCLAESSVRQQSAVDVCCTKSNSSVNVANPSTSIALAPVMKTSTKGVLNKNSELAKSYDCISLLSNNQERQSCLQTHKSSTSLVDMPQRKLVKPYSVINRCSTFGRKSTTQNVVHSSSKHCNKNIKTENAASSDRSSLASQDRASELFDLPEIDEVECDCQMSAASRIPTDETDKSNNARELQSPVETIATIKSPSICPSTHQNSTERYRSEYSTFLSAFPPKDCKCKLIAETVEVVSSGILLSPQDCDLTTIKQDKNEVEDNSYSTTRFLENCAIQTNNVDDTRLNCYGDPYSRPNSCIPPVRPITLPAEIPTVEDAAADAAGDKYVVTYESDNIVVLDRAPVIDCLTPDGDVVSTELACQQLLTMPTDSVSTAPGDGGLSRTLPLSESGYDTWKSSQGSVAVTATCVDFSAEQHQKLEKDGTLRSCNCDLLKAFDAPGAQIISEKNVDTEERVTYCPEESSDSLALFKAGGNLPGETVNSVAGASVDIEVEADDRCGESVSCDDESGRVADCSVEDSALRDAQMFVSICSDVAEPVAGSASSWTAHCAERRRGPSLSPPDNAVLGLTDPSDICFSLQTIPADDTDELSTPRNTAHLDRFNEDAHDASFLLPGMDHFRYPVDVEVSRTSDFSADVSTRNSATDFDAGKDCVADAKHLDESRGRVSKLSTTDENTDSTKCEPFSTATVVTAAVSSSAALDSYETICDNLLESVEENVSDSEKTHPSSSACQSAEPCPRAIRKSSEDSYKLKPADDQDIVTASGGDLQSTHSRISAVDSNSPSPPSTVPSGRLPVMTSRRVRTNFSVISCQTASQPKASKSRQSSAHVKTKSSSDETTPNKVDHEPPGTVGCRRALAVLASRLDEHGRRRHVKTNFDEPTVSKPSFQSAAVQHDPNVVAHSPAARLSSQFRPGVSSAAITHNSDTPVVDHDYMLNSKPTQSSVNVDGVATTRAESKLPMSTTTTARSSVTKKPVTFRKLLSSKLSSVVRRTHIKSDVNK